MPRDASELARRLARDAEAVCRHYLSNGRRQGRYWTVGDVRNTPGRSMFVRLSGPESGPGAAGRWTDSASTEYGDLLDVIRESCGLVDFRDVAEEARRFLCLPRAEPGGSPKHRVHACRRRIAGSGTAALRDIATDHRHARGAYLRHRGITTVARRRIITLPSALLLSAGRAQPDRDLAGDDRRRHRSFRRHHRRASHLAAPDGLGKAPIETQRKPWAVCSAMPSALARPTTSSLSAKVSRRCCRCAVRCLPCRWLPRSRPTTLPPSAPADAAPPLHRPRRRCLG